MRVAVAFALAIFMVAAAIGSTHAIASCVIAALLFPIGRFLLRDATHPARVALLGACVIPASLVLHDLIALYFGVPIVESIDADRAAGFHPSWFALFFVPLVAGTVALVATLVNSESDSRLYGLATAAALLVSLFLANYHFSMS